MDTLFDRISEVARRSGLSLRQFSTKAGLSPTHISTLLRRLKDDPGVTVEAATLEGIASAGGVKADWLLHGDAPRKATASPAPPPVSETRVTDDKIDNLIDAAFDPAVHKPSDVSPVQEALRGTALLAAEHLDPVTYVRRLLDAHAEARVKGRRIPADQLPFAALGVSERALSSRERQMVELQARLDRLTAQADAFIAQEGLVKPPPGEVHPSIKKAQDRERERKTREGR